MKIFFFCIKLVFLFSFITLLQTLALENAQAQQTGNWLTYSENPSYTVTYPPSWKLDTSGQYSRGIDIIAENHTTFSKKPARLSNSESWGFDRTC